MARYLTVPSLVPIIISQPSSKLRKRNRNLKGTELTQTLDKYAQTGKEYTKILEQIINQNNLSDFETVQLTNSVIKKELNL